MFTQRDFHLTEDNYIAIETWANSHECKCRTLDKASKSCCGGELTVKFTPITIGTAISVECICGKHFDVESL